MKVHARLDEEIKKKEPVSRASVRTHSESEHEPWAIGYPTDSWENLLGPTLSQM